MRAIVMTGQNVASKFVSVPWVHRQFAEWLGVDPFPGTLNLQVTDEASLAEWRSRVETDLGLVLEPGEEGYCAASWYPMVVEGAVKAGAVVPHVDAYPKDVIELVAGEHLRRRFGWEDGDEVQLDWDVPPAAE